LPANTNVGATVLPTGVIFIAPSGGANPPGQAVTITNPSSRTLTFSSAVFVQSGPTWFNVQPPGGTVAPGQSVKVTIQPTMGTLPPSVYQGEVTLRFAEDGAIRRVAVIAVVTPAGTQQANPLV